MGVRLFPARDRVGRRLVQPGEEPGVLLHEQLTVEPATSPAAAAFSTEESGIGRPPTWAATCPRFTSWVEDLLATR